ncbi:MAG TPA: hypothetical protein PKE69_00045 [Pyrinomonadaceae bacterium]|nr:hypothetical protein [Pyrinomonadaceae bacterium]
MKNVFIAIGGSGTKVAEALVKLITAGFPTKTDDNGIVTSAGDSLTIWRVDPDRNSGAAEDLKLALDNYRVLQGCLSDGDFARKMAMSRWGMDILSEAIHLDPLDLPEWKGNNPLDNKTKTLKGILDSNYGHNRSSIDFLNLLYSNKELNVPIDRGFYQRPFIGSAIMAIFAQSLIQDASIAGEKAKLNSYKNTKTRFFLCGSLHGGTGACGVSVIAQFLKEIKNEDGGGNDWTIGGCFLAPYFIPPDPPAEKLDESEEIDDVKIKELIKAKANHPAFANLTPEQKESLAKQILEGFYADTEGMILRARHGLDYYNQLEAADKPFDELYLVGKSAPNKLVNWSNGGASQRNPLNSAEVVAAISALNFFADNKTGDNESYVLASSDREVESDNMYLYDLPIYDVNKVKPIDPEKVLLATSLLNHLVLHHIPWEKMREAKGTMPFCKKYDGKTDAQINTDLDYYKRAFRNISWAVESLFIPHTESQPSGWHPEVSSNITNYFSPNAQSVENIKSRLEKKTFWGEDKGPNILGQSKVKFTSFDFSQWCPGGDFTPGEYLRFVWNEVFQKCKDRVD